MNPRRACDSVRRFHDAADSCKYAQRACAKFLSLCQGGITVNSLVASSNVQARTAVLHETLHVARSN